MPRLALRSLPLLLSSECPNVGTAHRTASEFKIKRAQASSSTTDPTSSRVFTSAHGGVPELDMSSGTADEAADRALTTVGRKLDRGLSTEYTVNELIAEATDSANLACMFIGGSVWHFVPAYRCCPRHIPDTHTQAGAHISRNIACGNAFPHLHLFPLCLDTKAIKFCGSQHHLRAGPFIM